jgi:tripartite-type tricarboxylate transporter receptor subunit TctC
MATHRLSVWFALWAAANVCAQIPSTEPVVSSSKGSGQAASTGSGHTYPTKPIRLLVPFAAGGSTDVTARILGAPVGQALGQNIVIDNRPGSGGMIATQETARANADGYTLLHASGAQMGISPALHAKPGYDPIKNFTHVIHLTDTPLVLVVHPALPAASAKEFIAYTLANKGRVNAASTGNGTYTHLTIELFKLATGADLTHVPYKGAAPAMNDLLGRQVQSLFTSAASAQQHIAAGRLKALGITAPKRARSLAEVPTFDEAGMPGLQVSVWTGISVPAGTPAPITARLAKEFGRVLQQSDIRERLAGLGTEVSGQSGEAFARMVREDVARWAKVVKAAGVKLE